MVAMMKSVLVSYLRSGLLICLVLINMSWLMSTVFAQTISELPNYSASSFELVPKVDKQVITDTYEDLVKDNNGNRRQFWEAYNKKALELGNSTNGVGKQIATWVMNWDTIIAYSAIIIEFISNLGLVVGAWFIVWSWYQYAMSSFGQKEDWGKAIKNALIGIAVIATSYGIFRLLTRIFIE